MGTGPSRSRGLEARAQKVLASDLAKLFVKSVATYWAVQITAAFSWSSEPDIRIKKAIAHPSGRRLHHALVLVKAV